MSDFTSDVGVFDNFDYQISRLHYLCGSYTIKQIDKQLEFYKQFDRLQGSLNGSVEMKLMRQ